MSNNFYLKGISPPGQNNLNARGQKFPRGKNYYNYRLMQPNIKDLDPTGLSSYEFNVHDMNALKRVASITYSDIIDGHFYDEVLKDPKISENEIIICYNELIILFLYTIYYRSFISYFINFYKTHKPVLTGREGFKALFSENTWRYTPKRF